MRENEIEKKEIKEKRQKKRYEFLNARLKRFIFIFSSLLSKKVFNYLMNRLNMIIPYTYN